MRSIDYAECHAVGNQVRDQHRNSARRKVLAEALADAMSKDRVRSLRSRVFNDLCRARGHIARYNALNGADALSIPPPCNSRSSAVAFSLFLARYISSHAVIRFMRWTAEVLKVEEIFTKLPYSA